MFASRLASSCQPLPELVCPMLRARSISASLALVASLGLFACKGEQPCRPMMWDPVSPGLAELVEVLPLAEGDRVCGMMPGQDPPALHVGHPGSDQRQIVDRYTQALVEAGFEHEDRPSYSQGHGEHGVFTRGELRVHLDTLRARNGFACSAVLRDGSAQLAKGRAEEEAREDAALARRREHEAFRAAVEPALPSAAELEAFAELEGLQACAASPGEVQLFSHDFLRRLAADEVEVIHGCSAMGELTPALTDLTKIPEGYSILAADCKAALDGTRGLGIVWWGEGGYEPPVLTKAGSRYDAQFEYTGGRFSGKLVYWSPETRAALCHRPLEVRFDLKLAGFEVDERGDMLVDEAQRQLSEHFKLQIREAAARALTTL